MTDTPSRAEIEALAAGLSQTQRDALLHRRCSLTGNNACVCLSPDRADLVDMGLAKVGSAEISPAWLINWRGLAVRYHLRAQSMEVRMQSEREGVSVIETGAFKPVTVALGGYAYLIQNGAQITLDHAAAMALSNRLAVWAAPHIKAPRHGE